MIKGKFNIVIGAQAGSEAKGKLAAFLARMHYPDVIAMSSSPNAGHTAVVNGRKYVTYHLPVSAVVPRVEALIVLGPASVINVKKFVQEIEDNDVDPRRIVVSERATLVTEALLEEESNENLSDIGSTLQGVGAARMAKIKRSSYTPLLSNRKDAMGMLAEMDISVVANTEPYLEGTVLCEMTQGYDLCLEHGIDPMYCTSKIIHPAMAMAEMGVPISHIGRIYGVLRPYPIRVNNRTGTSGPYTGAEEITWEDVRKASGMKEKLEEITTTTRLPRRVFSFSWRRFRSFIERCGPTDLCLQFANYIDVKCSGMSNIPGYMCVENPLPKTVQAFINELEIVSGVPVNYVGTGPEDHEMLVLL